MSGHESLEKLVVTGISREELKKVLGSIGIDYIQIEYATQKKLKPEVGERPILGFVPEQLWGRLGVLTGPEFETALESLEIHRNSIIRSFNDLSRYGIDGVVLKSDSLIESLKSKGLSRTEIYTFMNREPKLAYGVNVDRIAEIIERCDLINLPGIGKKSVVDMKRIVSKVVEEKLEQQVA